MKPIKHEARMSNDARIAVLETTILNINSTLIDIKQEMKRSFERIDNQFDTLEKKMDAKSDALEKKMDAKFDALENKMDTKFNALENKMDSKFHDVDIKFTSIDNKFEAVQNRLWSNFLWLMGMIIGLAGLIAHTQHWI